MNSQQYIDKIISDVQRRDSHEVEFIQAVQEVFSTLKPALDKNPKYIEENNPRNKTKRCCLKIL